MLKFWKAADLRFFSSWRLQPGDIPPPAPWMLLLPPDFSSLPSFSFPHQRLRAQSFLIKVFCHTHPTPQQKNEEESLFHFERKNYGENFLKLKCHKFFYTCLYLLTFVDARIQWESDLGQNDSLEYIRFNTCFLFFVKAPPLSFRLWTVVKHVHCWVPRRRPFGVRVDSSSFSVRSSSRLRAGKLPVKRPGSKYLSFWSLYGLCCSYSTV